MQTDREAFAGAGAGAVVVVVVDAAGVVAIGRCEHRKPIDGDVDSEAADAPVYDDDSLLQHWDGRQKRRCSSWSCGGQILDCGVVVVVVVVGILVVSVRTEFRRSCFSEAYPYSYFVRLDETRRDETGHRTGTGRG